MRKIEMNPQEIEKVHLKKLGILWVGEVIQRLNWITRGGGARGKKNYVNLKQSLRSSTSTLQP